MRKSREKGEYSGGKVVKIQMRQSGENEEKQRKGGIQWMQSGENEESREKGEYRGGKVVKSKKRGNIVEAKW